MRLSVVGQQDALRKHRGWRIRIIICHSLRNLWVRQLRWNVVRMDGASERRVSLENACGRWRRQSAAPRCAVTTSETGLRRGRTPLLSCSLVLVTGWRSGAASTAMVRARKVPREPRVGRQRSKVIPNCVRTMSPGGVAHIVFGKRRADAPDPGQRSHPVVILSIVLANTGSCSIVQQ